MGPRDRLCTSAETYSVSTSCPVAAALLIAGGAWWLLDSTIPVSDYDAAVAELDATKEALEELDHELAATTHRLT